VLGELVHQYPGRLSRPRVRTLRYAAASTSPPTAR
jgi:hypothetical protein